MSRLVVIIGPTGIGKSRLALHLAQALDGEIVSADSRQVYRYLDIGTAKPTPQEQAQVRHHLIDIMDPGQNFSLAQYQQLANEAIRDIRQRRKLALLVGGSGLYIWSVVEGWEIPEVAPDPKLRLQLERKAAEIGYDGLYQELLQVDPAAARQIDPRNLRRTIRALEVYRNTGIPFSQQRCKRAPLSDILVIGLTAGRAELYRRIDRRVDEMIDGGLVGEVQRLAAMGYGFGLPAMSGIGYKQIGMFLEGKVDLAAAARLMKTETHRLARHQYAWFKLKDDRIKWFTVPGEVEPEITELVTGFIAKK
ncbi:tRNA (adenosine(37)-N6)-dimethylallyltransferase MiaA [Chloroflexota bacterium]